jgi:hypothetical protein
MQALGATVVATPALYLADQFVPVREQQVSCFEQTVTATFATL